MAMSEEQEKTERATQKRINDAHAAGQIPRSRDLNSFILLMTTAIGFLFFGKMIARELTQFLHDAFVLKRSQLFDSQYLIDILTTFILKTLFMLLPLLVLFLVAVFIGPLILGRGKLVLISLGFQMERMNPIKGLKRMFALQSLVEFIKTMLKFILIGSIAAMILWYQFPILLYLAHQDSIASAIPQSMWVLQWSFIVISSTLILLVILDIPYQLWDFFRHLRMSKRELRDEYKETETRPEVKARMRRQQYKVKNFR
jgi:flagellar biosynthetic protein FlhB